MFCGDLAAVLCLNFGRVLGRCRAVLPVFYKPRNSFPIHGSWPRISIERVRNRFPTSLSRVALTHPSCLLMHRVRLIANSCQGPCDTCVIT